MGDSPQGDVEGLGHAHLEAVKVHLELGRDGVSCGPGPLPPSPGQASSTSHTWDPESGVGEGSENRQGTAVLRAQAWGWTGGPGADAGLTCRPACRREALGTRTVWHCVSWVSRLVEQASRPCRLSVERGPTGCQTEPSPVKAASGSPSLPSGCHGQKRSPEPPAPQECPIAVTVQREGGVNTQEQEAAVGRGALHGGGERQGPQHGPGHGCWGWPAEAVENIFCWGEREAKCQGCWCLGCSLQVARWGGALGLHKSGVGPSLLAPVPSESQALGE